MRAWDRENPLTSGPRSDRKKKERWGTDLDGREDLGAVGQGENVINNIILTIFHL